MMKAIREKKCIADWGRIYNTVRLNRALDNFTLKQNIFASYSTMTTSVFHMFCNYKILGFQPYVILK